MSSFYLFFLFKSGLPYLLISAFPFYLPLRSFIYLFHCLAIFFFLSAFMHSSFIVDYLLNDFSLSSYFCSLLYSYRSSGAGVALSVFPPNTPIRRHKYIGEDKRLAQEKEKREKNKTNNTFAMGRFVRNQEARSCIW